MSGHEASGERHDAAEVGIREDQIACQRAPESLHHAPVANRHVYHLL